MHKTLMIGFYASYVLVGSVAGLAHVHGESEHNPASRGLHLDHAHVEHHHIDNMTGDDCSGFRISSEHADHGMGDALYLSYQMVRSNANIRVLPVMATSISIIARPVLFVETECPRTERPRDPPWMISFCTRAPPA